MFKKFSFCRGVLSAPQRRIAYDTAGKFLELQQALHQNDHSNNHHQDWAAVSTFSSAVSTILQVSDDDDDDTELTPEGIQTSKERALWDLISLFAVDPRATQTAAAIPDLPRWLRSNAIALAGSPSAAPLPRDLLATLQQTALPETHLQFWPTVHRIVALGWVEDALTVLGLHSAWLQWGSSSSGGGGEIPEIDAQVAVLEAATLLLRRMPSVKGRGASGGGTTREFDSLEECLRYRASWQQQCVALLEDEQLWERCIAVAPETASNVERVVRQLAGGGRKDDDDGNEDEIQFTKNWAELLVARLVHVHPERQSLAELRQVLHSCLQQKSPPNEFHHVLAAVLDACCDGDPQTAMRACSVIASDWLMAHIPTILAHHPGGASLLGRELPHLGASQIEFYILDYSAALAPHATTWPLAASYLAWCDVYGQAAFSAVMERLPLQAVEPKLALKAAEICADQGAVEVAALIERVQGVLSWQGGLIGAAVTWLSKGGQADVERIDAVLKPLATELWSTSNSSNSTSNSNREMLEYVATMEEAIEAVPAGSAHQAMVQVKTRLAKNDYDGAVALLRQLPSAHLKTCLEAVWAALPTVDPSKISSQGVMQLLQWLEAYGKEYQQLSVARLALVRLLVGTHAS